MASYVTPERAAAYVFFTSLTSQADVKLFQDNPTLAAGDVLVATDDGAPANITTLPVVDADFTRRIKISLSAAEMTGENISVIFHDAADSQWCDLVVNIQTSTRQIDDLATPTNITAGTITTVSGNVTGSVGSVVGDVGGNVVGTIGANTWPVGGRLAEV